MPRTKVRRVIEGIEGILMGGVDGCDAAFFRTGLTADVALGRERGGHGSLRA
jgi:hypothetical protein